MHHITQSNQIHRAIKLSKKGEYISLCDVLSNSQAFAEHAERLFTSPKTGERSFFKLELHYGELILTNGIHHEVGCGYSISPVSIKLTEDEAYSLIKSAHH